MFRFNFNLMFAAWYLVGVLGIIAGVSGLAMLSGGDGGAALPLGWLVLRGFYVKYTESSP